MPCETCFLPSTTMYERGASQEAVQPVGWEGSQKPCGLYGLQKRISVSKKGFTARSRLPNRKSPFLVACSLGHTENSLTLMIFLDVPETPLLLEYWANLRSPEAGQLPKGYNKKCVITFFPSCNLQIFKRFIFRKVTPRGIEHWRLICGYAPNW